MVGYLVENWFSNGKGTIMGIILSANGLGAAASEMIVTRVVYGADGQLSYAESHWKEAYLLIAALFLIVGILTVLVIRDHPEKVGLKPMWQDRKRKAERGADWEGPEPKTILRSPCFYISGFCVFLTGLALQTMVNVSKPHLYDLGFDKEWLIGVFTVHAIVLFAAKTLAGVGYDTIGMKKTYARSALSAAAAILSLFFLKPGGLSAGGANAVLPWVYSIVSCFGLPLETVLQILLVSYLFGKRSYKRALGYYTALLTLGYALGVPLANLVYDRTGSYTPVLPFLAGAMLFSLIAQEIMMLRTDRFRKKQADSAPETLS